MTEAPEPSRWPRLEGRVTLGQSGLRVSPCCIGAVEDPNTIPAAYAAGVNFFFVTADMHWPAYESSRIGLRTLLASAPRDDLVVAVVSYVTQPEFCSAPFEEVLSAVPGLGHVDVAVIGGTYPNDFFVRLAEYERCKPGGMRARGATFHHRQSAPLALERGLLDVGFIRYNSAHAGAKEDVFPHLTPSRATPLYSFKSVGGYVPPARLDALKVPADAWRPRVTDHYRYALSQPEIAGVLCSLDTPAHVTELSAALGKGPLSVEEAEYLQLLSGLDAGDFAVDES